MLDRVDSLKVPAGGELVDFRKSDGVVIGFQGVPLKHVDGTSVSAEPKRQTGDHLSNTRNRLVGGIQSCPLHTWGAYCLGPRRSEPIGVIPAYARSTDKLRSEQGNPPRKS